MRIEYHKTKICEYFLVKKKKKYLPIEQNHFEMKTLLYVTILYLNWTRNEIHKHMNKTKHNYNNLRSKNQCEWASCSQ